MSNLETLKAQHPEITQPGLAWSPELKAMVIALLQHYEATIAELKAAIASDAVRLREHADHIAYLGTKKAEAEKVIQQQARELEEADKALIYVYRLEPRGWTLVEQNAAFRAAVARHSARAQQEPEAKKGE